jgi:2-hydroxymuconate-semialdehyde hydrolase
MGLSERDIDFDGLRVHLWQGGSGYPLVLMHGSGPGVSTVGNFGLILEPLMERYAVLAFDLIGFGQSARKAQPPYFDLELWLRQASAMIALLPDRPIGVLGHSLSASLALRLAASEPRITKVITTGAMGARFRANEHTARVWTFPETREALRRAGESLVYDKSIIDEAWIDGRAKLLHGGDYRDYFSRMFAGDKQRYVDASALDQATLDKVGCEVLMVHGRDDEPFPFAETSLPLGHALALADVVALARCGHSPALEQPKKLVQLARMFLG